MTNSRFKFRVWDKLKKKMIYPGDDSAKDMYISLSGILMDLQGWCEDKNCVNGDVSDEYEAVQSTGLYDCEGKGIWEGDVLIKKLDNPAGGYYSVYSIEWNDGGYCLQPANYNLNDIVTNLSTNFKVIGNRFESPELLEGKR